MISSAKAGKLVRAAITVTPPRTYPVSGSTSFSEASSTFFTEAAWANFLRSSSESPGMTANKQEGSR